MSLRRLIPSICPGCGINVCNGAVPYCPECLSELQRLLGSKCRVCGKDAGNCTCADTKRAKALFFYGPWFSRRIIYNIKRNADRETVRFLCELLVSARRFGLSGFEAVGYVPRRRRGLCVYGYDQARLIASETASLLSVPLVKALARRGIAQQKLLSAAARKRQLAKAYRLLHEFEQGAAPPYKTLALIDDVCTTGATVEACASLLRGRAAKNVVPVTLAVTNINKYEKVDYYERKKDYSHKRG